MNIGVFGGSFNPPHIGHLVLAQSALDALKLDAVLFVPAYASPFKSLVSLAAANDRCEMVQLAVSDNTRFRAESWEALREETSYTVDTLRYLKDAYSGARLHLLLGADTFEEFHLWKNPDDILSMVTLCVAERPGHSSTVQHAYSDVACRFSMPLLDISSTDIRRRVCEGHSIQYLVPWAVKVFIESRGLYRRQEESNITNVDA